jgi:hypothetical protein
MTAEVKTETDFERVPRHLRRRVVIDVDDLVDRDQIEEWLVPLQQERPDDFLMTAYAVPNRLGDVHALKIRYPWLIFGIHGWEHTHAECLGWTDVQAKAFIEEALSMGYDPIFKAPNWLFDEELEAACRDLEVVIHHHRAHFNEDQRPQRTPMTGCLYYPGPPTLRAEGPDHLYVHTHLIENPSTDHISMHPGFRPQKMHDFSMFMSPIDRALGVKERKNG